MKKVTLIALPAPFLDVPCMNPQLGVCYIGTVLKEAGYNVEVVDYTPLEYDYSKKKYLKEIPLDSSIYGISCVSAQFKWMREITAHIKKNNPSATVVVGGPHASSEPESCLRVGVDIAFNGEGEDGILDIVKGKHPSKIPGACYMRRDSIVIKPRVFIDDLNRLPLPDLSLFDIDRYKRKMGNEKAFHIMTLRGCPYNCNFCDSDAIGGKVRYIDKEKVVEWIDYLTDTYGVSSFVIYDDTFTTKRSRVKYFCKEFKKRKIRWRCWSRANSLRYDDLVLMKDAGIESIAIGIESGDPTVLKNINKRTTVEHNMMALNLCKVVGVPVRCSLMFGNPGETINSLRNTIKLIKDTQPDEWNLSILMPTPGSEFWNRPHKHGVHFDKAAIIANDYCELNRSSNSGIGNINISIDSMEEGDMEALLEWFVDELDRVCPRKKIRDTIQEIKVKEL